MLPAAAALKKQGANNGATVAFLISTPESGVDSISITYALLDPIMTLARPISAFVTAFTAGILENLRNPPKQTFITEASTNCPVDNCCDGVDCSPEQHRNHHTFIDRLRRGSAYAIGELWGELAVWFFIGIFLAGVITALVPDDVVAMYLGGGIFSMFLMLGVGVPLYICATASTPVAAALILKGVSPGTALIFLLVGPATNITSLSVLVSLLGKRATALYLSSIVFVSLACGLALDAIYLHLDISARAIAGQAAELIPWWLQMGSAVFLLVISVQPVLKALRGMAARLFGEKGKDGHGGCGCDSCNEEEKLASFPVIKKEGQGHSAACGCSLHK